MPEKFKTAFFIVTLAFLAYFVSGFLASINRFLDPREPASESMTVTNVVRSDGWPKVCHLDGHSRLLSKGVAVPVLNERARQTTNGQAVEIAIGRGLLGKPWVATKDKYTEYDNLAFKVIYLGLQAAVMMPIVFLGIGLKRYRIEARSRIVWGYLAATGVGVLLYCMISK